MRRASTKTNLKNLSQLILNPQKSMAMFPIKKDTFHKLMFKISIGSDFNHYVAEAMERKEKV